MSAPSNSRRSIPRVTQKPLRGMGHYPLRQRSVPSPLAAVDPLRQWEDFAPTDSEGEGSDSDDPEWKPGMDLGDAEALPSSQPKKRRLSDSTAASDAPPPQTSQSVPSPVSTEPSYSSTMVNVQRLIMKAFKEGEQTLIKPYFTQKVNSTIAELQAAQATLAARNVEITTLRDQLKEAQLKANEHTTQLKAAQDKATSSGLQLIQRDAELKNTRENLLCTQHELRTAQGQLKTIKDELKATSDHLTSSRSLTADLDNQLAATREQLTSVNTRLNRFTTGESDFKQRSDQLDERARQLNAHEKEVQASLAQRDFDVTQREHRARKDVEDLQYHLEAERHNLARSSEIMNDLKRQQRAFVDSLRQSHAAELQSLQQKHRVEIERLRYERTVASC